MKFIYLVLICLCSSARAGDINSDVFFLHTKYVETIPKTTEDKSYQDENGNWVIVPPTIYMKFKVVDNLYSDDGFGEKYLTLPLDVGTDYPFSLSNGVVFILKRVSTNKGIKYNVLDWAFVGGYFCIDEKLVPPNEQDYYFRSPLSGDEKRKCRFL